MPPKRRRQRQQMIITGGVLSALAVGLLGAWLLMGPADPVEKLAPQAKKPSETEDREAKTSGPDSSETGPVLVADDGRTLWASPTAGDPLPLEGVPPGSELILSLRPAEMQETKDGRIVFGQFREVLAPVMGELKRASGILPADVQRLTVAVRPGESFGQIDVAYVFEPQTAESSSPTRSAVVSSGGKWNVARLSSGNWLVASPGVVEEVLDAGGEAPPLRREMEQLVDASDGDRHASLLVAPSFLFAAGQPIFSGGVTALRDPLFEELPDDLRGVLLSVHWQEDHFYWELRCAAAAEMSSTRLAGTLDGRIGRWANELQMALLDLNPAPHGRRLVANLPAMTRVLAKYTRWGVEGRQAVLNGCLPPAAGHNLLLAGELMLAQQSAGGGGAPRQTTPGGSLPQTAKDRLQRIVSVSFDRDTLEMAVRYLSDEIGMPIVILGGDLQLDGITKNQSFGLDARNKPGGEVLVEILRLANPDKTASGPADNKQKLVYVLKPDEAGRETIYVTTRAAVAKRGERLPAEFEP